MTPAAAPAYPAAGDLQALLLAPPRRPFSRNLLFRFGPAAGARRMLAALADGVVTLGEPAPTRPLTSLGLTCEGLLTLGLDPDLIAELDPRFQVGFATVRLGAHDGTPSAVANWWGGRFTNTDLHCVVQVHAASLTEREEHAGAILALAARCGVTELLARADGSRLDGAPLPGGHKVHFGYTDGISAPRVAWTDPVEDDAVSFRNFVLGYSTAECFSLPAGGPAADYFRGSAYGVFAWIYQDVAAFNRFLRETGPALFPDHPEPEELLAAKLMGRWRDGTPLALAADEPDPALATTDDFDFRADPDGLRCPFSAHIRVMNPRNQPLKPAAAVEGVPRVLRRGAPYGPELTGTEDDGVDRGLIGVFLCTDIERQVLRLTMWAERNDFSSVFRGAGHIQDALIGSRAAGAQPRFTIPRPQGPAVATLPSFTRTNGSAFLLYPGRVTLSALA